MNEQQSIFLPIALTVLISAIVFGSLGYYLAKSRNTKASPLGQSVSTAIPTPSNSKQLISSTALHFTVDLPAGWTTKEREDIKNEAYVLELSEPTPKKDSSGAPQASVYIGYNTNLNKAASNVSDGAVMSVNSLEEYLTKAEKVLTQDELEKVKISVGGQAAYITEQKDAVTIYTTFNKALYFVTLTSSDTYKGLNSDEKSILSSIKFIN